MIDKELFEKAVLEVALKKLATEIREWIIYQGTPEQQAIYQRYQELKNESENRTVESGGS